MILYSTLCLVLGFCLDMLIGDPHGWPHLVILYGKLISFFEKATYDRFNKKLGGLLLVLYMLIISAGVPLLVLWLCWKVHPAVYVIAGTSMNRQMAHRGEPSATVVMW